MTKATPIADRLIGTTEASKLLGKSPRTVHRMVTDGKLVPVFVAPGGFAGTYLFNRDDVLALVPA